MCRGKQTVEILVDGAKIGEVDDINLERLNEAISEVKSLYSRYRSRKFQFIKRKYLICA